MSLCPMMAASIKAVISSLSLAFTSAPGGKGRREGGKELMTFVPTFWREGGRAMTETYLSPTKT